MQAVLILAHDKIPQLVTLAKLLSKKFCVYIHLDKKCAISTEEKNQLTNIENVSWYQEYKVNWGGGSIVFATQFLMRKALQNPHISYVHIISGQDWPAADINHIYCFYEDKNLGYMDYARAEGVVKTYELIIYWQKFYFDYDAIPRKTLFGKVYHRVSMLIQYLFRVDKLKNLNLDIELYQGSQWCSLPREMVEYLLKEMQDEKLYKLFSTGFCSDEFWMQTILCNSDYTDRLVNDNKRFILWKKQYDSYPGILDESNYNAILARSPHFMRKIDLKTSGALLEKLKVFDL